MPTDYHQALQGLIFEALMAWTRHHSGKVRVAPLRLRIREGLFREPDLLLLKDTKDPRRENRFWTGADLVIEIVSPDHPERDLVEKRLDYAEASISEYWIVDPRKDTISLLQLDGDNYRETVFSRGSLFRSGILENFELEVDTLFDVD